jgi:hypothetical protein
MHPVNSPHLTRLVVDAAARAQTVGDASQPSFYDVLKADPAHNLIMRAVEMDKEGVTKAMLQKKMPVTALVPTDTVCAADNQQQQQQQQQRRWPTGSTSPHKGSSSSREGCCRSLQPRRDTESICSSSGSSQHGSGT